jgi:DNA-binding LacI/PurR family transcriptional regulator
LNSLFRTISGRFTQQENDYGLRDSQLQRINIHEVAKRAKVSIATVSRAINGKHKVSKTVARRVWRVIEEIGYCPNTHARTLKQGRSRIFGLMVSGTIVRFFPQILDRFTDLGVEHKHDILLSLIPEDSDRHELVARGLIGRCVDGVAILTFRQEKSLIKIFERSNVHVFAIDAKSSIPLLSTVQIDCEHGMREAVQHLASLGHLRIAFVEGSPHSRTSKGRKDAFRKCMKEIVLSSKLVLEGDHTVEAGVKALSTLCRLTHPPSAIICSNDITAIGVLRAAQDLHVNIPKDISVVGFDDIDAAQFTTPALTTVRISQIDIANAAFDALLNASANKSSAPSHERSVIKTNLVLRASTAIAACRLSATDAAPVRALSVIDPATNKEFLNVV